MSQPDHEAIVNQIRSAQIAASPELRARVREIAAQSEAASSSRPPRRELPWRRGVLVFAPAALAVCLAGALTIGLATSGEKGERDASREALPFTGPQGRNGTTELSPPAADTTFLPARAKSTPAPAGAGAAGNLPATPGRAQLYEAELTLKVDDLSAVTKRALRMTNDFHGYVRSVEYGSGAESGSAYMVLRVPVGSVQEAIMKFSGLGTILDQNVSIQDVQPTLDRRFREMQGIRDSITRIQAKLESPSLTAAQRTELENQLVAARRGLVVLQRQQSALQKQTSFATVELDLETGEKQVVVPSDPSRIGMALHRSGEILAEELKVAIYVLLVGAPIFVLLAFMFGGLRVRRRRDEARLMATS